MTREYTHQPLNMEVHSIAGWYELEKEEVMEINGVELLYIVGDVTVDNSCCGVMGCQQYALVPGYVQRWKYRQNEVGLWISEVESVTDLKACEEITRLLKEKELISQVQFL